MTSQDGSFILSQSDWQTSRSASAWMRQSNLHDATLVTRLLGSVSAAGSADDRAARIVGVLQRSGLELNPRNLEHAVRLVGLSAMSPGGLPPSAQKVRELAAAHAGWSELLPRAGAVDRSGQASPTPRGTPDAREPSTPSFADQRWFIDAFGRLDNGRRSISPDPPRQSNEPEPAGASSVWSNERIGDAVDKMAREQGITAPAVISLMKSLVLDPSMMNEQRAQALNLSVSTIKGSSARLREVLGSGKTSMRIVVAERIGMPFSAVVARIRVPADPGVTQRVLNKINPSHREFVARTLLTVQPGTGADTNLYRALDVIFNGGDFYASREGIAAQLGVAESETYGSVLFLQRTFGGDRVAMLSTMGFRHEQILSMNPVGAELTKRFDPALGTYSTTERALRQQKNLPVTREEAAKRLLLIGVGNVDGIHHLSFRNLLAIGMVSDRPSLLPSDVSKAFADAVPGSSISAGTTDVGRAFRAAQVVLGRDIPRGPRNDLMDPEYRQQINLVMLQAFGLGATRVGSGVLEPIATDFAVSSWPAPRDQPAEPGRAATPTNQGGREATWQELVPLLQRHVVKLRQ